MVVSLCLYSYRRENYKPVLPLKQMVVSLCHSSSNMLCVISYQDLSGVTRYDGHHSKGEEDDKWVTYKGYQYDFSGIPLESLRIAPNAMDALMACQQAFS